MCFKFKDNFLRLTLNVTILLSLVFYLNIMSEYIPRGYSKTPILTFYALSNFTLVFLSCSFTVCILRLYYRPPLIICSKQNHSFSRLPNLVKLILFKYMAPLLLIRVDLPIENIPEGLIDENEYESRKLLQNLKLFNKTLNGSIISNSIVIEEKNRIYEEWKNAALILDR